MTEKDLGRALLNLDARQVAAALDPRQQTQKLLARDRRRVRLLAGVTVFLWLVAAAGIVYLIFLHFTAVVPRLESYIRKPGTAAQQADVWVVISKWAAGIILGSVMALLMAAVCTVFLVFTSRRATLRQINTHLLDISEQLRLLREALGR